MGVWGGYGGLVGEIWGSGGTWRKYIRGLQEIWGSGGEFGVWGWNTVPWRGIWHLGGKNLGSWKGNLGSGGNVEDMGGGIWGVGEYGAGGGRIWGSEGVWGCGMWGSGGGLGLGSKRERARALLGGRGGPQIHLYTHNLPPPQATPPDISPAHGGMRPRPFEGNHAPLPKPRPAGSHALFGQSSASIG